MMANEESRDGKSNCPIVECDGENGRWFHADGSLVSE